MHDNREKRANLKIVTISLTIIVPIESVNLTHLLCTSLVCPWEGSFLSRHRLYFSIQLRLSQTRQKRVFVILSFHCKRMKCLWLPLVFHATVSTAQLICTVWLFFPENFFYFGIKLFHYTGSLHSLDAATINIWIFVIHHSIASLADLSKDALINESQHCCLSAGCVNRPLK